MRPSRSTLRSALAAVTVAAATCALAPAAHADPDRAPEDARARVHAGNVTTCEDFAGVFLDEADLSVSGGAGAQYLTIDSIPTGKTVDVLVVKGGNNYNVYMPGERELPEQPPWDDLRAPTNGGGQIPKISHWFACGTSAPQRTPASMATTPAGAPTAFHATDTEPSPRTSGPATTTAAPDGAGGEATTPSGTAATAPSSSRPAAPEVTSTTDAVPVATSDDTGNLAHTGFGNAWLIWLGAALVLAGAAALVLLRVRRGRG